MTADKVMILDLETQTNEWFGRKASPRHPDNYVVMTGVAIDAPGQPGEIVGRRFTGKADWLSIPDDVWLIVAHNASFEVDWMLVQQREEFMKFLKRGGRIFCTATAHYLLSNQRDTYPALDFIAPMYGGSHKVDGVKLLWEQGVQTSDIDPALLAEYLLGPEGDIENTRKVFYEQVKQLQERGMWTMALERMEGLLSIDFCMDAGLYVNRPLAEQHRKEMEAEFSGLIGRFREHRSHFPSECEFKESSDFHMSAWLYGGPVKYRARVPALNADGSAKYEKLECYKFGETYISVEAVKAANDAQVANCIMEYGNIDRFKAGKNKDEPKVHKIDDLSKPATKWGELIYKCKPLVDLTLLQADVRKQFLDEYTGKRKLADESPVISTGSEPLEMLSKQPVFSDEARSVLRDLLKWARLDKDLGTYYLREELDDDGNVVKQSGMLQYVTPESIVHHSLNNTSTSTTRLSGTRPNMQNLPRGDDNEFYKSRVKELFTSRFGDDGVIIEADYKALEVVTLACMSGDAALIRALLEDTDMHCLRLSKKLGESYESVLEKCGNKEHPEHKKYKQMRTDIKPPSFAYQYGATAMGISFSTGMPVEEAEKFIANEKALFPDVETFYDKKVFPQVEASIKRHREQMDDGSFRLFGTGTWVAPGGTTYEFRQYPKTRWADGQRLEVMEFKPTQMRNYPIQGESGYFVQVIGGLLIRWLIANDFFGGKCLMINQVHDAFYFDVHKDVLHQVAPVIKQIMEYLPQYFSQRGYNMPVPFPAEVEYGPSMADKQKYHKESA